jgi:hypothetical protein
MVAAIFFAICLLVSQPFAFDPAKEGTKYFYFAKSWALMVLIAYWIISIN